MIVRLVLSVPQVLLVMTLINTARGQRKIARQSWHCQDRHTRFWWLYVMAAVSVIFFLGYAVVEDAPNRYVVAAVAVAIVVACGVTVVTAKDDKPYVRLMFGTGLVFLAFCAWVVESSAENIVWGTIIFLVGTTFVVSAFNARRYLEEEEYRRLSRL